MLGYKNENNCRAVARGPAGPTLVGPLFGSKMRVCLDDSYARAHSLMDSSFTEITTQKFADIPERPLTSPILRDPSDRVGFLSGLFL